MQEYPIEYAECLADAWLQGGGVDYSELFRNINVAERLGSRVPQAADLWQEARLEEVTGFLGVPCNSLVQP